MSIIIDKRTGFQILRLTSESISEPETNQIIDSVRSGLSEGIRCQAISLEVALSSNIMMMGLLVICERMVQRFEGILCLIIRPERNESGLRALCESLNIEVFDNECAWIESVAVILAKNREEERIPYHQLLSNFVNRSGEFYHNLLPAEFDFSVTPVEN